MAPNMRLVLLVLLYLLTEAVSWEFHIVQQHPPPGHAPVPDTVGATDQDKADTFMDTKDDAMLDKTIDVSSSPVKYGSRKRYFRWHQQGSSSYGFRPVLYPVKPEDRQPYPPAKPGSDKDSQDASRSFSHPDDTQESQKWPDPFRQPYPGSNQERDKDWQEPTRPSLYPDDTQQQKWPDSYPQPYPLSNRGQDQDRQNPTRTPLYPDDTQQQKWPDSYPQPYPLSNRGQDQDRQNPTRTPLYPDDTQQEKWPDSYPQPYPLSNRGQDPDRLKPTKSPLYPDDTQPQQKWPDPLERKPVSTFPEKQPDSWVRQPYPGLPGGRSDVPPSDSRTFDDGLEDQFEQKEIDLQSPGDPKYVPPAAADDRLYGAGGTIRRQQPESGYRPQWMTKDDGQAPEQIPDAASDSARHIPSPVYPGRQQPDGDRVDPKPDRTGFGRIPSGDGSPRRPPETHTERSQDPDEVTEPGPSQYGSRSGGNWHRTARGPWPPFPDSSVSARPGDSAPSQKPPDYWPIDEDDEDSGFDESWRSQDLYPTRSPQTGGRWPDASGTGQHGRGSHDKEPKPPVSGSRSAPEADRWPDNDDREPDTAIPRYPEVSPLTPPHRTDPNEVPQAEDCPDEESPSASGPPTYGRRQRPSSGYDVTHSRESRRGAPAVKSPGRGSVSARRESLQRQCCIQGRDVAIQDHDPQTENIFTFCGRRSREISRKLPYACQWVFYKCCENTALRTFYLSHLKSVDGSSRTKG